MFENADPDWLPKGRRFMSATHNVTQLLARWAKGDEQALHELTPIVCRNLRVIAASYLRKERQGHTLQPTALVNEAYLRLAGQNNSQLAKPGSFSSASRRGLCGRFW